jgi:hypothetical protein
MNASREVVMETTQQTQVFDKPVLALSWFIFAAGVIGMAISFVFLASTDSLDVIAGGAGFVAGSIFIATSVITVAIVSRPLSAGAKPTEASHPSMAFAPAPVVDRWTAHFRHNRENRTEPPWDAPLTLPSDVVHKLVRSLEQFQLGDGGGPACLIAWNAERLRASSEGAANVIDMWFAEEREHARLLGAAVARFGGQCIRSHWSFTAFCLVRRWLGVRFELTVLLLTEIVSSVYYRLMRRHGWDVPLRAMCRLILRDEAGHIAFHRDRLASCAGGRAAYGKVWELRFRTLGLAAASMLWVNHGRALKALGATRAEFFREVWMELSRFVCRLRQQSVERRVRPVRADAPPPLK